MNSKKDIGNLCRIKVNKMLSSLNSNKNIFIPKYTLSCRDEEKYSYLNKAKVNPAKSNYHTNLKKQLNKNNITTTEDNYEKQPVDFIINHGVLVYQRNFKGEEVINMGINNEFIRKNNFNKAKNNNTIYQADSNFRKIYAHKNESEKGNNSTQKKLKFDNSKRTLASMSDIPISKNSKNKNSSSRQNKILSTNLNTTQNSISSANSISVKNFMICPKNKAVNEKGNNNNPKIVKKVINFIRKKKNNINNNNNNKILFKKKKNLSTLFGNTDNVMVNNRSDIKGRTNNYMIPNIPDNKYKTNYIVQNNSKKRGKVQSKKINNKNQKDEFSNNKNNIIKEKLSKLVSNLEVLIQYYLKIYFPMFKNNLIQKVKYLYEKNLTINTNIPDDKIDTIDINKLILEKCRQNKNLESENSFYNHNHKKSNSIIVNKKVSSNTASIKGLSKHNSNKNLSILISKNLRFFSKEKNTNNKNEILKSELYRDSKNLQKKYEQICRRKKKQLTMNYISKFKDNISSSEGNFFSEANKTNSFSTFNDNISVNSLNIKNNYMLNHYDDNNYNEKNKYLTENKKDKNSYKIKLIKGYDKNKKIISYRIEKNKKEELENNIIADKYLTHNYIEFKKNLNHDNIDKNIINKKNSFNSNSKNKKAYKNNINEINKINKKIFIHKRKKYLLEDKQDFKLKDIDYLKHKNFNIKNNNISLSIKNISSRDKRIFLSITYIPYDSKSNNKSYDCALLKEESIYRCQYLTNFKRNKNIIKRKNDFQNKLSLIREEDEKSKYLNSTKSSKFLEEDIKMFKKNFKKEKNLIISSIINSLQNNYKNFKINCQKEFIYKLKTIYLSYFIKNIINRRIKDTYLMEYFYKNKGESKRVYYSKAKNKKIRKNIQQISNIYIKDKIYLNNIIINENIVSSHSFDFQKKFNTIEIPELQHTFYYKKNRNNFDFKDFESKTETFKIDISEEN